MEYKWNIKQEFDETLFRTYQAEHDMLDEALDDFIHVNNIGFNHPRNLSNIEKAVARTKKALENKETIFISGDYDVDGVTSTASMFLVLSQLTAGKVDYIIPSRKTGYGMNKQMVDYMYDSGCKLIITVDNGIASHDIIKYAESLGMDVIVTDHHLPQGEMPCDIVVNPHTSPDYPFKNICGCFVAYKFLQMLVPNLHRMPIHSDLIAFVTLATIADVMPLQNENRKFVKNGLEYIRAGKVNNLGFNALIKMLKLDMTHLTSGNIAFYLAPAINAIGRIDNAEMAVMLLTSEDEAKVDEMAKKAVDFNNKRKDIQSRIMDTVKIDEKEEFIIKILNEAPLGIMGIIAGNFAHKYNRPCIILHENGKGVLNGSGRSVGNFDIEQCIVNNSDIVSGGGHKAACGIKAMLPENVDEFKKRCCASFKQYLLENKEDIVPTLDILCPVSIMHLDDDFMFALEQLSPFGQDNPELMFVDYRLVVDEYSFFKDDKFLRMTLSNPFATISAVGFADVKDKYVALGCPKMIDIVYNVEYNYFRGRKIELMIRDLKATPKSEQPDFMKMQKKPD